MVGSCCWLGAANDERNHHLHVVNILQTFLSSTEDEINHQMIRYRLKELIADKEFRERRQITLGEIAEATGIHRTTLSKIANAPGYNTVTDNVDKLCVYFDCEVDALMQRVRDLEG